MIKKHIKPKLYQYKLALYKIFYPKDGIGRQRNRYNSDNFIFFIMHAY
ncbi:MAG: hypothetical protein RIQ59_1899 [Bacteroidota bacterium]|jgi:hypothetical protein